MHWPGGRTGSGDFFAVEITGCLSRGGPKQSPFWQEAVCHAEAVNSFGGNPDISYMAEAVIFFCWKASIVSAGAEVLRAPF